MLTRAIAVFCQPSSPPFWIIEIIDRDHGPTEVEIVLLGMIDPNILASIPVDVVAQQTADAHAGLCTRNVVEAGAVGVADADIFHRLRFSDHDGVGAARSRYRGESRSRAEKKALDVHFQSPVDHSSERVVFCRRTFPAQLPKKTRTALLLSPNNSDGMAVASIRFSISALPPSHFRK
jgi:hypothetical protein